MVEFETVDRPESTIDWKDFIQNRLLTTALTGKAAQVVCDDPKGQAKSLRTLFSRWGYGRNFKLHITVEDDCLIAYVTVKGRTA